MRPARVDPIWIRQVLPTHQPGLPEMPGTACSESDLRSGYWFGGLRGPNVLAPASSFQLLLRAAIATYCRNLPGAAPREPKSRRFRLYNPPIVRAIWITGAEDPRDAGGIGVRSQRALPDANPLKSGPTAFASGERIWRDWVTWMRPSYLEFSFWRSCCL